MSAAPFFSEPAPAASPESGTPHAPRPEPVAPPRPCRINPYKMWVGSFVPYWLLCRREVSQGAKLCYARLAQFAGEDGLCYPKQTTLAAEVGVTERTARDYIRELEEFNLIESVQNGLRRANNYYFLDHPWIFDARPDSPTISFQDRQTCPGLDRRKPAAPTDEEHREEGEHTQRARGLPRNEVDAVEAAKLAAIPEEFARAEFNRMEAVNWLDGCQRPVRSWPHYLKKR